MSSGDSSSSSSSSDKAEESVSVLDGAKDDGTLWDETQFDPRAGLDDLVGTCASAGKKDPTPEVDVNRTAAYATLGDYLAIGIECLKKSPALSGYSMRVGDMLSILGNANAPMLGNAVSDLQGIELDIDNSRAWWMMEQYLERNTICHSRVGDLRGRSKYGDLAVLFDRQRISQTCSRTI